MGVSSAIDLRRLLTTLTTVANAMRVGDHLIERLGARAAATA